MKKHYGLLFMKYFQNFLNALKLYEELLNREKCKVKENQRETIFLKVDIAQDNEYMNDSTLKLKTSRKAYSRRMEELGQLNKYTEGEDDGLRTA